MGNPRVITRTDLTDIFGNINVVDLKALAPLYLWHQHGEMDYFQNVSQEVDGSTPSALVAPDEASRLTKRKLPVRDREQGVFVCFGPGIVKSRVA